MFKLTIVTPDRSVIQNAEAEDLVVTGFSGELNILPGHTPLMTLLRPGRLVYRLSSGKSNTYFVNWGYCQVQKDEVLVLAELAKTKEELDKAKIQERHQELTGQLQSQSVSELDYERLMNELEEARAAQFFVEN
ncbi:MAG: ATP synthase F1 subunit epsilon [Bdellovibrionaceae bacterium]|nr:ATP synthase F1 subunit epsilon [Pseudobdellovibrionaceae bacterium]MDW8189364.1 ATP synthase F1 subunit epsilon [Pseudobdellovibrionaceae bacterium]